MKINKTWQKLTMIGLSCCLLLSSAISAFAEGNTISGAKDTGSVDLMLSVENATFSVTVPMYLPVTVDSQGNVTTASDAEIVNNSSGPVQVTNVSITPFSNWVVVDYNTNMKAEKVNAKKVGLKLNETSKTQADGSLNFDSTGFRVMNSRAFTDGSNKISLNYNVIIPAQEKAISNTSVANLTFTVAWYEG